MNGLTRSILASIVCGAAEGEGIAESKSECAGLLLGRTVINGEEVREERDGAHAEVAAKTAWRTVKGRRG